MLIDTTPLPRSFSAAKALGPRVYRVRIQGSRRGFVAPAIGQPGWTAYEVTGEPIATAPTRALAGEYLPA